jgi:hypothetical protein
LSDIRLQKRRNDFFVSYGHGDLASVVPLVNLLKRVCGMQIWFDGTEGNAALRSSELLAEAIGNSRGSMFCLSEAWKRSTWCKNEYEVSLSEQRQHDGFEIVSLRLDDVEAPDWFKVAEIVDLRQVAARSIARLLRSLSYTPHRFDNAEDFYLATPWSKRSPLALETLGSLRQMGWRLVGDNPNLKHFNESIERIKAIQRTCRGVVALLPHEPKEAGTTSPYIVEEGRLAVDLKKPLLLLAEPGVVVPEDLPQRAFRRTALTLATGKEGRTALVGMLNDFDEECQRLRHDDTEAFIFFAASLLGDSSDAEDIALVIERASNMLCVRGERLSGDNVQEAIIERIRRAAVVIADISDDHRNTLIEAGIAMGSGRKLKLICNASTAAVPKKPFMFEGVEVLHYQTPEERLGLCFFYARQFRRSVYVIR